jgi:3'(2'), 5'-bisphosphate nucleotidase
VNDLCELALHAARMGGAAILSVYRETLDVEFKGDGSPLTLADQMSHRAICEVLAPTGIPLVSEEGDDLLLDATRYWLVDPLDGTKDFLAGNDEFTVNVALVQDGFPVFGVLYAPALGQLYFGHASLEVWRELAGIRETLTPLAGKSSLRMVTSRFHDAPDSNSFAVLNGVGQRIPIGSTLKFGRLACADADVYPRLCEYIRVGYGGWPGCAGGRGRSGYRLADRGHLSYGKLRRRNGGFLAFREPYAFKQFKWTPK